MSYTSCNIPIQRDEYRDDNNYWPAGHYPHAIWMGNESGGRGEEKTLNVECRPSRCARGMVRSLRRANIVTFEVRFARTRYELVEYEKKSHRCCSHCTHENINMEIACGAEPRSSLL